jgi:hypothetical protein
MWQNKKYGGNTQMKTEKTGKPKKPLFKRWWFWLLILVIIAGAVRGGSNKQQPAPAATAAPAVTADPAPATAEPAAPAALVFTVSSAEPGEYGRQITLNAGTANESSFYGFYIPAGEYTASNMDQKSAVQLTFCKDGTAVNTDGVEEIIPAEQRPLVLMGGQSGTFTLSAGEYVKLSDDASGVLFEQAAN